MKRVGLVGGGVIGSSIAYYLTQYDAIKTYLFEKAQIGSGTSAKSAGTVCLLDDSLPEAFFNVRVLALRTYLEMEKESHGSAGFKRTGTLVVCPTEGIRRFVLNAIEMSRKNGFAAEYLDDPAKIKRIVPDINTEGLLGAGYTTEDGYVDATQISVTYANKARQRGAEILTRTKVNKILRAGNHVTGVETDAGNFDLDIVVNAAGPWAHYVNQSVSLDLPLMHTKANVFILKPTSPFGYELPILKYPRFYTKPETGRVFACRAHLTMDLSKSQDAGLFDPDALPLTGGTDPSFLEFLVNEFSTCFPKLAETGVTNSWLGYRMETKDYLPIVGDSPIAGYLLAVGAGGNGVILAPTIGQMLAKYIGTGEKDQLLDTFGYSRLKT